MKQRPMKLYCYVWWSDAGERWHREWFATSREARKRRTMHRREARALRIEKPQKTRVDVHQVPRGRPGLATWLTSQDQPCSTHQAGA